MAIPGVATVLILYFILGLLVHLASIVAVLWRLRTGPVRARAFSASVEPLSIIRPVSQADFQLDETLASTFSIVWPEIEIIFCAASESDDAVAIVRRVLARYPDRDARLLVGDDCVSSNPKLNNCIKGWRAARFDLIAVVDSNVMMPPDYAARMLEAWDQGCGMVSSPPVGVEPLTAWANLECAFLNGLQARWQLFADALGTGFAQGKNLLFRKSILDRLGGLEALACESAEDAAATKVIRKGGYHVRLSAMPFGQPLGARTFAQVWQRQVRWARLRRTAFLGLFLPEIITNGPAPFLALGLGLWLAGYPVLVPMLCALVLWYGPELFMVRKTGWSFTPLTPVMSVLRDLLIPAIWVSGLMGRNFEWQGHAMKTDAAADSAP